MAWSVATRNAPGALEKDNTVPRALQGVVDAVGPLQL